MNAKALTPYVKEHANVAEIVVSDPSFRRADATPFIEGTLYDEDDVIAHQSHRALAKEVIFTTLVEHKAASKAEQDWEMARTASLHKLGGTALGSFDSYFVQLEGKVPRTINESYDLPPGEPNVVATNRRIVEANEGIHDPINFLDTSLGVIQREKKRNRFSIGPENYATALKYFADKYAEPELGKNTVDMKIAKELVEESLSGLFDVARRDEPNFLEMTNIYVAIRTLPAGIVAEQHVKPLLLQSFRSLDTYSSETIQTMFGAIAKLPLAEHGPSAAGLINLALRKSQPFETTQDFRVVLRALSNVSKSPEADQALRTLLEQRNDIEQSLDLEGADEVMSRLLMIANTVIDDVTLHEAYKQVAENAAKAASNYAKKAFLDGSFTPEQQNEAKNVFARIMQNYKAI